MRKIKCADMDTAGVTPHVARPTVAVLTAAVLTAALTACAVGVVINAEDMVRGEGSAATTSVDVTINGESVQSLAPGHDKRRAKWQD